MHASRVGRYIYDGYSPFPWGVKATTDTNGHYELKHLHISSESIYASTRKEPAALKRS